MYKLKEHFSLEKIKEFLSGVGDKLRDKAEEMGHKAGKGFVAFMMKDSASADLGWMVGKLVGQIILEVVLAFFTAGIGTAIKWAGNAIRGFRAGAKLLKALTKAFEILKMLGGIIMDALRWIFSGIKKAILSFQKMGQKGMAALGTAWDNVVALLRKLGEKIGMKMDDIGSLADETKHLDDVKHLDDTKKTTDKDIDTADKHKKL